MTEELNGVIIHVPEVLCILLVSIEIFSRLPETSFQVDMHTEHQDADNDYNREACLQHSQPFEL